MIDISAWFDFKLGEKKLSDFGGTIINNGSCTQSYLSSLNIRKEAIVGHDGEVVYGTSTRNPIVIEETIAIVKPELFNERQFKQWIDTKNETWFNYVGDNKKIKVLREEGLDSELAIDGEKITISFIGHSGKWDSLSESKFTQSTPSVNISYNFNNNGDEESYPLIRLSCIGSKVDTEFQINDLKYRIKNMTNEIYIDCKHESVYINVNGEKVSRLREYECFTQDKFKFTFPSLKVGANTFKLLKGSLSKVEISINEHYI